MSAFSAWFLGIFCRELFQFAYQKIQDYLAQQKQQADDHAESADQARQDTEPLKHVQNEKDPSKVDGAIDDATSHL